MEDKNNSLLGVLLVIIILLLGGYLVYENFLKKEEVVYEEEYETEYVMHPKKYGVNEYSKLNISNEQMSTIYYNDYMNLVRYDEAKAYALIDSEYKKYKVKNIEQFRTFINSKKIKNSTLKEYKVIPSEGYTYYILKDSNDNDLVFKTKGVMQYTVYLDDETVVIK